MHSKFTIGYSRRGNTNTYVLQRSKRNDIDKKYIQYLCLYIACSQTRHFFNKQLSLSQNFPANLIQDFWFKSLLKSLQQYLLERF